MKVNPLLVAVDHDTVSGFGSPSWPWKFLIALPAKSQKRVKSVPAMSLMKQMPPPPGRV